MIIDQLAHAGVYRQLSPLLAEALRFLQHTNLAALADGRFELEADGEFAEVENYTTKPVKEKRWEAHRKYADLQVIISGAEWMGYSPIETLKVIEPYDQAKDIEWLQGEGSFVPLPAGSFEILSPQDAHMPGVCFKQSGTVKKLVFKLQAHTWACGE